MTSSSELLSPVSSTMPMLTPTLKMRSFQTKRYSPIAREMSSAICRALSSGHPTSSTPNSSPPMRATVSESRTASRIRAATSRSMLSPARWPLVSLTALNRSRSR